MRAWILVGSLAAAVGATACGTQAVSPFGAGAGQTALRCEPGQRAVVNQAFVDGGTVTSVSCAAEVAAPIATRPVYREPAFRTQPVAYEPAPVERPAVVRSETPAPARTTEVVAERKPTRSWQKRAMVIGGSSGAGAGLGALIGGKKGALIGAAIGAGGGTVYEVTR
jgi:hypothetical protein